MQTQNTVNKTHQLQYTYGTIPMPRPIVSCIAQLSPESQQRETVIVNSCNLNKLWIIIITY